ncbi:MAG: AzlD domain-containing protein [Geminicoccaceae bacterium]
MPSDLAPWAAIAVIAGVTFASRLLGSILMSRIENSAFIGRFLDGLSVSVIAALIASILAQGGIREAAATALAALVMFGWKSAVGAMIAGMIVAATWTFALTSGA